MERKWKWDEITGVFLFALGAGMLLVSVFLSFSSDIWYDELYTMGLACQPLGRLVSITARDVHPPLYYIIVKIFLQFFGLAGGEGQTAAAKIASVVPFFLCLFYSGWKVRKYFGWLPAGLFAFLLPAMPKLADYTVEVRMYGYCFSSRRLCCTHMGWPGAAGGGSGETGRRWPSMPLGPVTPIILPVWLPVWFICTCLWHCWQKAG